MGSRLWCGFVLFSLCARTFFALNQVKLDDLAIISNDDKVPLATTEIAVLATTEESYRRSRWQRHEREGFVALGNSRVAHENYDDEELHHDDVGDNKAMSEPKQNDYWGGYYDFLINEGSYKFWAVFQLATAALLIYSGFAALYYAKVNPQIGDDFDDDFLLRRRRRSLDRIRPPRDRPFFGFEPQSFQRILDAVAREFH